MDFVMRHHTTRYAIINVAKSEIDGFMKNQMRNFQTI